MVYQTGIQGSFIKKGF